MWLDDDGHSVEIIRAALKEAVLAEKLSLRYIDRILFEWKKKNVKTIADVEKQTKKFRTVGIRPTQTDKTVKVKRVPFYNWLEERD
jgi:DNA replication protein